MTDIRDKVSANWNKHDDLNWLDELEMELLRQTQPQVYHAYYAFKNAKWTMDQLIYAWKEGDI